MTKLDRYNWTKDRLVRLENSIKNTKCPGVVRKLRRQVRNMENELNE